MCHSTKDQKYIFILAIALNPPKNPRNSIMHENDLKKKRKERKKGKAEKLVMKFQNILKREVKCRNFDTTQKTGIPGFS